MSNQLNQIGSLEGSLSSKGTLEGSLSSSGEMQGSLSANLSTLVTVGNIEKALGYMPANVEDIVALYNEINHMKENATSARVSEITLLSKKWSGKDYLYSQVVTVDGLTPNSQVDLTPSVDQLAIFYEKDLTFVTENDNGVLTVYAIGQKPSNDYVIQVTITEVAYE